MADLPVDVPLVQQLSQSGPPQFIEVFIFDRKTAGFISAQQNILQTFLLKNQSVFLQKVSKQVPVDLRLVVQVVLQTEFQVILSYDPVDQLIRAGVK